MRAIIEEKQKRKEEVALQHRMHEANTVTAVDSVLLAAMMKQKEERQQQAQTAVPTPTDAEAARTVTVPGAVCTKMEA
jgi:phosphoribosyl-dephospho-CoA transferase